ncbi:MAG: replicative DNA helicase [Candidatus Acidiferrales bacterium]
MPSETSIERPLPHYLVAEKTLLGVVLLNNAALVGALEKGLTADDFFLPEHRYVFEAMMGLDEERKPIDAVTLTEHLHRKGKLEASGGPAYISQLADGVPRAMNVEHYTQIIREKAVLRGLIHAAEAIQERAFEARDNVDEILDQAESWVFKLAEQRIRTGFIGIKQLVSDNFSRIERIFTEGRRVTGLASGYTQLDNQTSGLQPSELIILAARPSMGKTALALNIAENVALRSQQPVAVFSLEMSKESLLQRLIGSQARIDSHRFRTGQLGKEDWQKIVSGLAVLGDAPLWIDDSAASTVLEMSAKARRLKKDKGLSLVVVDYLQLITAHGRFGNRTEEVSYISRALKGMAKELQVPVVVLSQLTRAPAREEREPQLADLRESGAIEQDADVVLFIHRPHFYKPDAPEEDRAKTDLIIAKQRNGPTGKLNFVFLSRYTRFEEAAPDAWDSSPDE